MIPPPSQAGALQSPLHPPHPQPTSRYDAIAHYSEAVLFIEWDVRFVHSFQVAGEAVAMSANENGLHEPTANALALARRINAKFPQIPVRLTHSLFVHLLDIAANRQIAAQAPNAEQRSGQFTMNCFLNPLKYATIAQS